MNTLLGTYISDHALIINKILDEVKENGKHIYKIKMSLEKNSERFCTEAKKVSCYVEILQKSVGEKNYDAMMP